MGFFQKGRSGGKPKGGKKKFGSKPYKKQGFGGGSGGYGGRDSGKQMHEATCADCGNVAQVPFKPNGSKPVLCRDCFRGSDDGDSRKPRRSERESYGKSRHDSGKRSFDRGPKRCDNSERKLGELNDKLDLVLDEIAELRGMMMQFEVVDVEDDNEPTAEVDSDADTLKFT